MKAMPAVAQPSRNSAIVSLAPRPKRMSIWVNSNVPNGRAMNASEKTANDQSTPSSGSAKGNITFGKTSTEAIA